MVPEQPTTNYMAKLLNSNQETTKQSEAYPRQSTFSNQDDGFRKTTFSRAFTMDTGGFRTRMSEGFNRTVTEGFNRFDPDAVFTKKVIEEYVRIAETGNDGDVPPPPGFARHSTFWKMMILTLPCAAVLGVAAAGFLNFADEIPKQWDTCDYGEDSSCFEWYNGEKYWIGVTVSAGFAVGIIRFITNYPDNLPGIFKEILSYHCDAEWAPLSFCLSAISLAGGATLGPEAALGNLGGSLMTVILRYLPFSDEDDHNIMVLTGMTCALGALFPSPLLATMMIHELGNPPKTFMESTIIMSVGAIIAFAVYYEMVGVTYLDHAASSSAELTILWIKDPGYQDWQIVTGFIIGCMSAIFCFMIVLTIGVTKQIFGRIRSRVAHNRFLKEVLPPVIGGLVIGLINWSLPGTVGNGNMLVGGLVKFGSNGTLSKNLLYCTGFARMVLLGVSMNCGFVGGVVFPFLTMGVIAGAVAYTMYQFVPLGLFISTFVVSIASGVVPMPFTLSVLSCFIFYMGLYQTVPVFVACITSYILFCGSGLYKMMINKAKAREAAAAGTAPVVTEATKNPMEVKETVKEQKEADDFALKQYLGGKSKTPAPPLPSPSH